MQKQLNDINITISRPSFGHRKAHKLKNYDNIYVTINVTIKHNTNVFLYILDPNTLKLCQRFYPYGSIPQNISKAYEQKLFDTFKEYVETELIVAADRYIKNRDSANNPTRLKRAGATRLRNFLVSKGVSFSPDELISVFNLARQRREDVMILINWIKRNEKLREHLSDEDLTLIAKSTIVADVLE